MLTKIPKVIPQPREAECTNCGHSKIAHLPDQGCQMCKKLLDLAKRDSNARVYVTLPYVCWASFKFKLSHHEREQAMKFDNKTVYENRAMCGACFHEWMEHTGYLCPNGDSTFVPLLGGSLAAHRGGLVVGPNGET